jgi:hypothetical protein
MAQISDCSYAELAALISGPDKPPADWLLNGLQQAAEGLRWTIRKDAEHPPRENLREQLQLGFNAANYLRNLLKDFTVQNLLAESAEDDLYEERNASYGLDLLIPRLEKALAAIPRGQSSHKYAPGTNGPLGVCALSVAVAWRLTRGSLPPHTSPTVQNACRLLWTLAGGSPQGYGGDQTSKGWMTHLKRAKADLEDGPRPEVERLFEQPAR